MEAIMRLFLIPALLILATPTLADEVTGTVLAFDRVDSVIVLKSKAVFTVPNADVIPADLKAGDTIKIIYKSDGDNGLSKVSSITRH
jgi:hypothetical protein